MKRLAIGLALAGCAVDPSEGDGSGHREPGVGTIAPPSTASIEEVVAWLDGELPTRSPGTDVSITVEDLQTQSRIALRGDAQHVSASE